MKRNLTILLVAGLLAGLSSRAAAPQNTLENRVQAALRSDPALQWHPLAITVITNTVVIEGKVNTPTMRQRAATIVGGVPGVLQLDNRTVVAPERRPDKSIAGDVRAALAHDTATESFEIDVTSEDAVVHLRGTVQSIAERRLAEQIAGAVRGVRAVKNELEYRPKAVRSDRELKREILNSLRYDARLAGHVFEVEVTRGEVTISGAVATPAQRLRAVMHAQPDGYRSLDATGLVVDKVRLVASAPHQDAAIKQALNTAFTREPRIYSANISIYVEDGVVTLGGKVDHLKAHREATRLAGEISGVSRVYNLIKVVPERAPNDETLRDLVRRHLKRYPLAENSEISIQVVGGVVTLTGTVGSQQEKWAATEAASVVRGVVEIHNRLKVLHPRRLAP